MLLSIVFKNCYFIVSLLLLLFRVQGLGGYPIVGNEIMPERCVIASESEIIPSYNSVHYESSSITAPSENNEMKFTSMMTSSFTTPNPLQITTTTQSSPITFIPRCPKSGGLLAYENDCRKFINCFDRRRPKVQKCAPGLFFNKITQECDAISQRNCQGHDTATLAPDVQEIFFTAATYREFTTPIPSYAIRGKCQKHGFIAYEEDCRKFINCFIDPPRIQKCAPGLLFNKETRECNLESKVICNNSPPTVTTMKRLQELAQDSQSISRNLQLPPQDSEQRSKQSSEIPLAPDSGQRIRLRGGVGPWEGYLEIRRGKDQPWGHVCDAPDSWILEEANVVCQHLGFTRGVEKSVQGLKFDPHFTIKVIIDQVHCVGNETSFSDCKLDIGSNCASIQDQVVGVKCRLDSQALCKFDEYLFGNTCYKIITHKITNRDRARTLCKEDEGELLQIHSQAENDFISELLMKLAPSINTVCTDGIAIKRTEGDGNLFFWEHSGNHVNFTNWWPGREPAIAIGPDLDTNSNKCIVLRNRFQHNNKCVVLPYFFWSLDECDAMDYVTSICVKKPRNIGCIIDQGSDYYGKGNVSVTGKPCLPWADPNIKAYLSKRLIDSGADTKSVTYASLLSSSHNYCRNLYSDVLPWCFTSSTEMEYCDIPKCPIGHNLTPASEEVSNGEKLEIRLANSSDLLSGRVEIFYNKTWGTICDDDFDMEEATVVCRMLGFAEATHIFKSALLGSGEGPIWLDDLDCDGSEKTLLKCRRPQFGQHDCFHSEDVGVRCSAYSQTLGSELPNLFQPGVLPISCGKRLVEMDSSDALTKIVHGRETTPGAFPWQVSLRLKEIGHSCGGTIISKDFVISAAHCMEGIAKERFILRVGEHSLDTKDVEEKDYSIESMYLHHEYNKGTRWNNDIVLIKVKSIGNQGIRFGSYVQPLCLPTPKTKFIPGTNCSISGWGRTNDRLESIKLLSATIPLVSDRFCFNSYSTSAITTGMFCAGMMEGGPDTCQGDSGGGLVCLVDGRPTLIGITSWGEGCGHPNKPGVYAKVTHYLEWLDSLFAKRNHRQ